ncbi:MAG: ABC transporter ATP-binding protein [Actinobacteria bacterium]|nr:MAG: ABC transporter ATP-binding protein [Actinomycetota bacterium]
MDPGDRLLARAVRLGGPWVAVLATATLVGVGAELLLPAVLGGTVDAALRHSGPLRWLAGSVSLIAALAGTDALADLAAGSASARATARLRHAVVRHVLFLDLRAAERFRTGDLVSRTVAQVGDAGKAGPAVVAAATVLVPSVGSVVALALIDQWLALTFLVGLAVLAVLVRSYVTDLAEVTTRYQTVQSDIAARLVEALTGARTIGVAGTVDRELHRILQPLPELAPLTQLAVLAVGGIALSAGRLSPGDLLAALQYATLGAGLGAAVTGLGGLARGRAGSRRTAEVLDAPVRRDGELALPAGPGRLELRSVTVRRGGDAVLAGIDLVLPAGATVAVVGPSGAGKSTLAAVAGGLVEPDAGAVLLDGVPLAELRPGELRQAIGYAFAQPVLVGDTVGEAIGLGGPGDPAAVHRAASAAYVAHVVQRLPDGYGSRLADTPLSGGERQRLGLARALRAERVLVLDDATSSLDTVTEYRVSQVLTGTDRRTRLVVTHRAGTAARADLVAWLEAGRVRGVGPHGQLWTDPAYRGLFQARDEP